MEGNTASRKLRPYGPVHCLSSKCTLKFTHASCYILKVRLNVDFMQSYHDHMTVWHSHLKVTPAGYLVRARTLAHVQREFSYGHMNRIQATMHSNTCVRAREQFNSLECPWIPLNHYFLHAYENAADTKTSCSRSIEDTTQGRLNQILI